MIYLADRTQFACIGSSHACKPLTATVAARKTTKLKIDSLTFFGKLFGAQKFLIEFKIQSIKP
jgi:hypothetical protein